MLSVTDTVPIDDNAIAAALDRHQHADAARVRAVLAKAREMSGLESDDMAALMNVSDPDLLHELFETAQHIKQAIYGRRLVVFAPLYVSNLCGNECTYCAFRARNTELERRALDAGVTLQAAGSIPAAMQRAASLARPGDRIVVFGSFHTVGPALASLGVPL